MAIILSAIGYFCVLFWLGFALAPVTYHFPLKADWKHIYSNYIPLEGDELLDNLISQNIEAIELNKEVNAQKAQAVRFGVWTLPIVLIILSGCRLLLVVKGG